MFWKFLYITQCNTAQSHALIWKSFRFIWQKIKRYEMFSKCIHRLSKYFVRFKSHKRFNYSVFCISRLCSAPSCPILLTEMYSNWLSGWLWAFMWGLEWICCPLKIPHFVFKIAFAEEFYFSYILQHAIHTCTLHRWFSRDHFQNSRWLLPLKLAAGPPRLYAENCLSWLAWKKKHKMIIWLSKALTTVPYTLRVLHENNRSTLKAQTWSCRQ